MPGGVNEQARLSARNNLLPRTMLGIMDVQTKVYDGALDLFKPCQAGQTGEQHTIKKRQPLAAVFLSRKASALLLLHDDLQQITLQQGPLHQSEAAYGGLVLEARLHDGQTTVEARQ